MNFAEELRLYEQVSKAAAYWQVEVYNYQGNNWETSRGPRVLKSWERGDFNETREMAVHLAKTSLVKVALPHKGADGGYLLDNLYYLVDTPQNRVVDLHNLLDLERVAKFLAKLHKLGLYERQGNVLSVHIMPNTFYVGRYGELTLWGFENLRVENPLLSLAHLLYDCENDSIRDFVVKKYEEIMPLDRNQLENSEKLIWDSAILLGHQGPKKVDTKLGIDKLQELVGMLWPLINMQEYSNVPVSEYMDTQEINPVNDVYMSDMSTLNTTDYEDKIPTTSYESKEEAEPVQSSFLSDGEKNSEPKAGVVEEAIEADEDAQTTQEVKEGALDQVELTEERAETLHETKKSEPLSWKPFPKLPNRRW